MITDMEQSISYPLSGKDLLNLAPRSRIIRYPDLAKARSIDEVLGPDGSAILLIEVSKGYGHWVGIFRRSDGSLEAFDSYGGKYSAPDASLEKFVPPDFRAVNEMTFPHLTRLLYKANVPVHYNVNPLQLQGNGINTCGRWVILRMKYRDMDVEDFGRMIKYLSKRSGLSPDEISVWLTEG